MMDNQNPDLNLENDDPPVRSLWESEEWKIRARSWLNSWWKRIKLRLNWLNTGLTR